MSQQTTKHECVCCGKEGATHLWHHECNPSPRWVCDDCAVQLHKEGHSVEEAR